MASKVHNIVFFHTVDKPITQRRVPQVVESQLSHIRPSEDLPKLTAEVVDDLQSSIGKSPLASFAEPLNVIVPMGWNKNVGISLGLTTLEMCQHKRDLLGQGQSPMIRIFDIPHPGLSRISLRIDLGGHSIKINVSPSCVKQLCSPHPSCYGDNREQLPVDELLGPGIPRSLQKTLALLAGVSFDLFLGDRGDFTWRSRFSSSCFRSTARVKNRFKCRNFFETVAGVFP